MKLTLMRHVALVFPSLALAATLTRVPIQTYRLAGTLHRLPVQGELRIEPTPQRWDVRFWFDETVSAQVKMLLEVYGDYIRLPNGDLECTASYTDARIVLRPALKDGGYTVVETNVDMVLMTIEPVGK